MDTTMRPPEPPLELSPEPPPGPPPEPPRATAIPSLPLRCVPSLGAPQHLLISFMVDGHGYDDSSVTTAIKRGNELFAERELSEAADTYGIAYEIAQFHIPYLPLMYDLVIRRILCYSMLGNIAQALHESQLALQIIPYAATVHLIRGVLHLKLGLTDCANESFQLAITTCRELHEFAGCLVGFFMLAQGKFDRAIDLGSRVLEQAPQYPLALLLRGNAYKFHPARCFSRQAAEDYTALLEVDISLQSFVGKHITEESYAQIDELLLRFHPRLQSEGPRPYDEYPMYHLYKKRKHFMVNSIVIFAVAKFQILTKYLRLGKNVVKQTEKLSPERKTFERQVLQDSNVQQPRRNWVERPTSPSQRAVGMLAKKEAHAEDVQRSPSPVLPQCPQGDELTTTFTSPPASPISPESKAIRKLAFQLAQLQLPPSTCNMPSTKLALTDFPLQETNGNKLIELSAREKAENVERRKPPTRIGQDWDEDQWLEKALELANKFGADGNTNKHASAHLPQPTSPKNPPRVPHRFNVVLQLPTAEGDKNVDLLEAVEQHGYGVIPDWYSSLDLIHDAPDMIEFQTNPEPFVPVGRVGGTGHSYIIPKKSQKNMESNVGVSFDTSSDASEQSKQLNEALVKRYQNRLLVTSLVGPNRYSSGQPTMT